MSSPIRDVARKLHLWLGLTAGLVVTVVCATGAILAFETEIVRSAHPEYYRVATEGSAVPLGQALDSLAAALPDAKLAGIVVQNDPLATWEFNYGSAGRAYVDPHTGRVLATGVKRPDFFSKTQELHRWLLAPDVGRPIVGAATICFVFILLFFILFIFIRIFHIPAYLVLLWWIGYQVVLGLPQLMAVDPEVSSGVAFWAHIGGFVAGLLLIKLFARKDFVERHRRARNAFRFSAT